MSKLQKQSVSNKKKIIILISYRYKYDTFLHKIFQCLPIGLRGKKIKQFPQVAPRALMSQSWLCYSPATFQSLSCALCSSLELLPVLTVHGHLSSGPRLADSPLFFAWLVPCHPSVLSLISIMT